MESDVLVTSLFRADANARHASASAGVPETTECSKPATGISPSPFPFAETGARIITDEYRRILWATAGAAQLTAGHSCVSTANGELSGRTRHSDSLLRDLSAVAGHPGQSEAERLIGPEPSHAPELFVRASSYSVPAGSKFIVFTLRSLVRDLQGVPDLGRLYGLTQTEQQITRLMLEGQSVADIANCLNKSVLTVRTHVKRVYSKLNVGTKEQLFSTVMKLMVD